MHQQKLSSAVIIRNLHKRSVKTADAAKSHQGQGADVWQEAPRGTAESIEFVVRCGGHTLKLDQEVLYLENHGNSKNAHRFEMI